ncbi:hypothetical protein JWYL7_1326 [Alkalithermobacter thermoalcaliphilus JW-YL-7 = DSM 7308]|nr:hypothetical protein JWYL7_1326 [[Clostridium] paradoxum JW-YL-7 = DSM 7308]
MNKNNLSSGIFFIILGVFLVLKNMNVITWSILPAFFDLWPLILILIGINIIFNKNKIIIIVSLILFF